jgi:hypothetical protein
MTDIPWRQLLSETLHETDPAKLRTVIDVAQAAIVDRMRELKHVDCYCPERDELHEGLKVLRKMQVERLGYPPRPAF